MRLIKPASCGMTLNWVSIIFQAVSFSLYLIGNFKFRERLFAPPGQSPRFILEHKRSDGDKQSLMNGVGESPLLRGFPVFPDFLPKWLKDDTLWSSWQMA